MNEQNNNTNGKVKSKFFNQDLFGDTNVTDVGGSSTGGQVISWGVGGNRSTDKTASDISILDSTQMFNFVNTEVTDFEENNQYSNNIANNQMNNQTNNDVVSPPVVGINMNNNGMQDANTGLFNGNQFAQAMDGQVAFDNTVKVSEQPEFTNDVNDVFAVAKFDGSVEANSISNEFVQSNPTFTGFNADPNVIAGNNVTFDNGQIVPQIDPSAPNYNMNFQPMMGEVQTGFSLNQGMVNPPVDGVNQNGMQQPAMDMYQQQTNVLPVTSEIIQPIVQTQEQPVTNNTIVVPTFDPFGGSAEPVQPYVPQTVAQPEPVMSQDLQMQQNSPLFAMAAETQVNDVDKNLQPMNFSANDGVINDDMRSNQPLSLMALSGESIDESQKPKDVLENNKYFQNTPLADNRLKVEDVAAPIAPVVDVLAEPTRDINVKELVKEFVGLKYTKISMSPFSFCGGFFGAFYYFFRKMYIQGIILSVINSVIMFIALKFGMIGFGLVLANFIVVGLLTNSIYINFATNQVKKIVVSNPKLNQYELQRIVKSKGGTNLLLAFLLSFAVNGVFNSIVFAIVGTGALLDLLGGGSSQTIIKQQENIDINKLIDIKLPSDFVLEDKKEFTYYIYETVNKKGKTFDIEACAFDISIPKGKEDSKKLIEDMANADQRYNRVSTYKTEAGKKWDVYSYDGTDRMFIYRAREFDNYVILISYTIHDYATEGMCELHLENIMNSIEEK